MFLTYVDESGKPNREDLEREFVIASLTIHEKSWDEVNEHMDEIKRNFFPNMEPSSVEIHAFELFDRRGVFESVQLDIRLKLFRKIMELVAKSGFVINAIIIRKDLVNQNIDIKTVATELFFERIDFLMNSQISAIHQIPNGKEHGLLLIDSVNRRYNGEIRSIIKTMISNAHYSYKGRCIIEEPFFVDSKDGNMIQLADCVAYCIREIQIQR